MKNLICLSLVALTLTGCAAKTAYRDSCASQLNAAWEEQSLASLRSSAITLLAAARPQPRADRGDQEEGARVANPSLLRNSSARPFMRHDMFHSRRKQGGDGPEGRNEATERPDPECPPPPIRVAR